MSVCENCRPVLDGLEAELAELHRQLESLRVAYRNRTSAYYRMLQKVNGDVEEVWGETSDG